MAHVADVETRVAPLCCIALVVVVTTGCAQDRESVPVVTWVDDVRPFVVAQCTSCHGALAPDAGYSLESYAEALGRGTDSTPNLIAGDGSSEFLTIFEGGHAQYLEAGQLALLRRWVIDDEIAYFWSAAHSPSVHDPSSESFHGRAVAEAGWDMSGCRGCHGADYSGGLVGVSCTTCHPGTPEACDTCHQPDADMTPHAVHLQVPSGRFEPLACVSCHLVPSALFDPGHVDNTDGRAEITFAGQAVLGGATPTYDRSTRSCAGTYCHAGRTGGDTPTPTWAVTSVFDDCDGCHGAPPPTMASGALHPAVAACEGCHDATVDASGRVVAPALHGDGTVQVRPGLTACNGCHAGPTTPAPFFDRNGQRDPTLPGVGAHDAHVGPGVLHSESDGTTGYACVTCHVVPASLGDPTHLDGGDPEVTFSGAAVATGLAPGWDRSAATCSDTWCHGSDLDAGPTVSPVWTDPAAATPCGSCHAFPPVLIVSGGRNLPHPAQIDCSGCHPRVIDVGLNWVDLSLHVNGTVEVGP